MPALITREQVIRGPGTVQLGSTQMFDKEGIKADLEKEGFPVTSSAHGLLDTRFKDGKGRVTFKPCGNLTAGILTTLFPHGNPSIGSSLLGATDVPCIVHSLAGTKLTLAAAALTKMPSLKLSTTETAFGGDAEIIALLKNSTARTTAGSMYSIASEAWSGAFDVADLKGGIYLGIWNGTTFQTQDGWTIDFEMEVEEQAADGVGTYDVMLKGVTARARCIPLCLSESAVLEMLNIQGPTAILGGSMRSGADLVISCATGLTVTLKEVALNKTPLEYGNTNLRVGEIEFTAHRAITGGIPAELFEVSLT